MTLKIVLAAIILYVGWRYGWPFVKAFMSEDVRLNKSSDLSNDDYRKLALGAPYASQQGAYQNSLDCGIDNKIRIITEEWWGITNKEEAHETLTTLCDEGSRSYFKHVLAAFKSESPEAQEQIIKDNVSGDENIEKAFSQLVNLYDCFGELQEDKVIADLADIEKYGSAGWDYGRIVFLARVCVCAGYLSSQEAWTYIDRADRMARKDFDSWNDYGKSYVLGRAMWGGKDSANSGIALIVESLLTDEKSPWVKLQW